jgi:hypothetical protein
MTIATGIGGQSSRGRGGSFTSRIIYIGYHNLCTLGGESFCGSPANAATTTRDEGNFPNQSRHCCIS